jgi:hypothetical protein
MSYLHPPPGDAPVVVYKDVGGYVDQYDRQTSLYFQTNREVRLHECRSACTLALALPNVCVYPGSQLKFHKAYNPETKDANDSVSDAMMAAYPVAVRQRLGQLTRNYKVLTGSELIRLGVRDCNAPQQPRVMVARARLKDNPPENPVSNAFGGLVAALTPQPSLATVAQVRMASVRPVSVKPPLAEAPPGPVPVPAPKPAPPSASAPTAISPPSEPAEAAATNAVAPTPPPRPDEYLAKPAAVAAASPPTEPAPAINAVAPTPPPRPDEFLAKPAAVASVAPPSNWGHLIKGSAPILLSSRFAPYPYRLASRS